MPITANLPDIGFGLTHRVGNLIVSVKADCKTKQVANAKKIVITTESHETLILHLGSQKRAFGFCEQCRKDVEMLTVDQAVSISGVKTSELVRRIELGEIHGIETQSGHLLICSELLPFKKGRKGDGT